MINNDWLEVFSFENPFEMDLLLFGVYSRSGREERGDSVV